MENQQNAPSNRYAYIDVLRGIAALMVVYLHTSETFLNPAVPQGNAFEHGIIEFFSRTIGLGEVGVCIFFMISGFIIPFSLYRYQVNPIKNFVAHRFFRLYPAYWLSIPLAIAFVPWHGGWDVTWPLTLANITMFQGFLGIGDIMVPYWTLYLELAFYLSCVALFASNKLQSFKHIFSLLIFFIVFRAIMRHVPFVSHYAFDEITRLRYMDYMFFGLLYRKWLLDGDKKAGWQALSIVVLAFLTFGAISDLHAFFSGDYVDANGNFVLKMQLTHLTALAIFVFFTRFYRLKNKIGAFLGKISYSIYLFHPMIFYPLYYHWFASSSFTSHPHVFIFAAMALSVLAAWLSYQLIEKPSIDFGRRHFSGKRPLLHEPVIQKDAELT
jgi:peptidoglycan/LPS O-acetylase OafA/YrhL